MLTPDQYKQYYEQVAEIKRRFDSLPRGARARAAEHCGIYLSDISDVLGGHRIHVQVVRDLLHWTGQALQDPERYVTSRRRMTLRTRRAHVRRENQWET